MTLGHASVTGYLECTHQSCGVLRHFYFPRHDVPHLVTSCGMLYQNTMEEIVRRNTGATNKVGALLGLGYDQNVNRIGARLRSILGC